MSATPNSATPKNSLIRRERVDPATLDLHDDRYDERPPPRPFSEKAAQLDADLFLDEPLIGPFFNTRSVNDVGNELRSVTQQFAACGVLCEAAAHDVWIAFDAARLAVNRDHGYHYAVLGKVPAVAQHFIDHLARAGCINQHASRRRLADDG